MSETNTAMGIISDTLTRTIDSIPRWPVRPIHLPGVADPRCFGCIADEVLFAFVASGNSFSGCQAYSQAHKSRDDSREAVLALFRSENPPDKADFRDLAGRFTLIMREAYKILPIAIELRSAWQSRFSCHINTNVYLSLPTSDAFTNHKDPHHVFVVQLAGSKRWQLSSNQSGQNDDSGTRHGNSGSEIICQEGDVLFIPKGTPHCAKAEELSVHVSISIEEDMPSHE
jgi:hypothetical protein